MSQPLVGVVILNWNRLDLTKQCLKQLDGQSYKNVLVVVVDNGSTDGSVTWLKAQPVDLIANSRNRGYARAVNQGIRACLARQCDYVVTLNNDAEPDSDWLARLVSFMEDHSSIDFAQGAAMQMDNKKIYDSTGIYLEEGFIPRQRALGLANSQLDIRAIGPNAAGAIYRTGFLAKIQIRPGMWFDSRFFAYVEDVDLDLRASSRGYRFAFVPEAVLLHHGSLTGQSVARRKMFWGARNQLWLVYKNVPWPVIRAKFRIITKSHLANLQFLWREQRPNFWPYLAGLVVGLVTMPRFYIDRRRNLKAQTISNHAFLDLLVPSNPPLFNPVKKLINLVK